MYPVRAKKHLGQHFLKDENIARKIAESLSGHGNYKQVLEIGPGTGMLTKYLLENKAIDVSVVEVDRESVEFLKLNFPQLKGKIIEGDFLRLNIDLERYAIIGNFPYNISSQIFFNVLEHRNKIPEVVCMIQREVAMRIASPPGSKEYGILSVLLSAFYDIEYLFTVNETVFVPPPKVKSGVIRLTRNNTEALDCNEKEFFMVVKTAFNQRRKTLRNALKSLTFAPVAESKLFDKRAEQLSVAEFVELTKLLSVAK
jgi:16S rRNA (adenine1518-N6/adenine1519-N6)-dimethyltransferase